MESVTSLYNVPYEMPLGIPIAIYFYMTGLSAGSFIISTLAYGFGMVKFKPLGKVGVSLAIILLMLAPINLMIDLEQPFRFWELFYYINLTSPISYGSFLLSIYPVNCLIYAFFMFKGDMKRTKFFGLCGIPLALLVHGYTGFILALGKARILWNTALMPVIFLVSAMVSGIAMMILVLVIKDKYFSRERKINTSLLLDLATMLSMSIIFDLGLIITDILVLFSSHDDAWETALLILQGKFAFSFVGIELILGAFIPLILISYFKRTQKIAGVCLASVLVMIGIFAMRYVMVLGGQYLPLH